MEQRVNVIQPLFLLRAILWTPDSLRVQDKFIKRKGGNNAQVIEKWVRVSVERLRR